MKHLNQSLSLASRHAQAELFGTRDSSHLSNLSARACATTLCLTTIASSVLLLFSCACAVNAQATSQNPPPVPPDHVDVDKSRLRDSMGAPDEEMKAKQSIKYLEQEYKHNVERAKEAAALGVELRDTMKSGKPFGKEETKKLDRLEKLARKIRDEAGGSADEESTLSNPPGKLDSALLRLADVAEDLYKSVEKTPRQVISATVIENANALLKLARITRNLFN